MSQQAYLLNVCINVWEPTFPLSPHIHARTPFSSSVLSPLYTVTLILPAAVYSVVRNG